MTQLKICGLTRPGDAAAADAASVAYGGAILAPGSPRTVSAERAGELFEGTGLIRCGVFVNAQLEDVVQVAQLARLGVLQLHGDEGPADVEAAAAATGLEVWKAVRPRTADEFSIAVERFADVADGLLLDGWSSTARGGTGIRFPWEEVAMRRTELPVGVRLVVAGGLTPANVAEVIAALSPDVVDVSSGVERAPGVKDDGLIRAFAEAVAGAAHR